MRRFTFFNKVGVASILSCLAILLGLYTTTGTASAHSANHPFINVVSSVHRVSNCLSFVLEGGGFTPNHHVALFASASGGANIDPDRVRAIGDGQFVTDVQACGFSEFFNNCGGFIDNPDFFCGFSLNPEEFCGLPGFSGFQSCFTGSSMKPVDCFPPNAPACSGPPSSVTCPPISGSCFGSPQGPQGPPDQPGSGNGNNQNPPGPQSPGNGGDRCQSDNSSLFCQPGSGNGGDFCQQHPERCNQGGQGNRGGDFCQQHPERCNQGNGNNRCRFDNQLPECFPHQPRFRFHRFPVSDFCRFHFHGQFPFCFRFFPREFPITIGITAADEHTGRRYHILVSFFGGSF